MIGFLSYIFEKITNFRNNKFDKGKIPIYKLDIPVISVGNISVGGTGKTPFVIMLAKYLISIGKYPGIVGRGYGRKSKDDVTVSNGSVINYNTDECGDEMVLIADKTNVPVIAGEKKWSAAIKLCNEFRISVLLIDDGFQHRYLHRDLDIILIDEHTLAKPFTMPKGLLRESLNNYKRADLVCLKGDLDKSRFIDKATINYRNDAILVDKKINNSEIKGTIVVASIAKPLNFFNTLNDLKIDYKIKSIFKDHHRYTLDDIQKIISKMKLNNCNTIITTEKDFVKLNQFSKQIDDLNFNLFTIPIETVVYKGLDIFKNKIDSIL
ncbi:tetraacyldisaccharide 4'-kinase [Candidatus Kapabacteria bacterium]|nr:tetraacyldisaccharide 4'-kinase [Candidatus Kapabacteria bacterium]